MVYCNGTTSKNRPDSRCSCHDGEHCHAFEAVRENIGRHLRMVSKEDDQHDAHHAQAGHNGQCDEAIIRYSTMVAGKTLRTGEFSVESNGNERTEKKNVKQPWR